MPTVSEELAGFCSGLRFEALPDDVVERTKELLLDYLGVCCAGARERGSQWIERRMARAAGGWPRSGPWH